MRIPPKLLSLITEEVFQGDKNKARLWFVIPNPALHGARPCDYKIGGKWDVLEKRIINAIKENKDERSKKSSASTP